MQELRRRLADLQAREEQLRYLVLALLDEVKPGHEFAALALALGSSFTARELEATRAFFDWAEAHAHELTAEEIRREFDGWVPRQASHLDRFVAAHRKDGMYPELCRMMPPDAWEGQDNESESE